MEVPCLYIDGAVVTGSSITLLQSYPSFHTFSLDCIPNILASKLPGQPRKRILLDSRTGIVTLYIGLDLMSKDHTFLYNLLSLLITTSRTLKARLVRRYINDIRRKIVIMSFELKPFSVTSLLDDLGEAERLLPLALILYTPEP